MKLLTKYSRVNITITIIVFLLGSTSFYFVLRYILIHELDETLRTEQQEIAQYVKGHNQLPEIENTREQWINFQKVMNSDTKSFFQSRPFYNNRKNENETIRQYIFPLYVGNDNYKVTVNKSQEETEDLLQIIIWVTVAMIAIILLTNFIINRKVLNRLWNPFYTTIQNIKEYRLSAQPPVNLNKATIDEFLLLNESFNQMALRIHKDYNSLKQFTENAAHEMQTPLAVIRSKIELMLQSQEWSEPQMLHLQETEDATQKLAKLHQSLLLLTKIENNQFLLNEKVDLKKITTEKINEKQDLFHDRGLILRVDLKEVIVSFHQHLAEILITNLLNNTIRYTPSGGEVTITLENDILAISNSSASGALDRTRLFQRFYKSENDRDGTGLGLAIVKEICIIAGFSIDYDFDNAKHVFTICFE